MVSKENYLAQDFDEPVYVILNTPQLYESKNGGSFNRGDFHHHAENYKSLFLPLTKVTDLFINAIFWDPKSPVFFTKENMRNADFRIKVIADITCDINGSIPSTLRESTTENPVYGYDPFTEKEVAPFQPNTIDVMAVSNLPNELPRESSIEFGDRLIEYVVEELLSEESEIISRASIAKDGKLMDRFAYLSDYATASE
jgi:alanine dehydrogenase